MTVQLPPPIERIVKDAVLSGQYRSAEDALSEAIAVWQAEKAGALFPTQSEAIEVARKMSQEEERQAAIERLKNFGKTHQLSLGGVTIKQLRDKASP